MNATPDPHAARRLDESDPLAALRSEFHLPVQGNGSPAIYLCGHSLGLAPKRALSIINEELDVWAQHGVDGHFAAQRPWVSYHEQLTPGLARLAGAATTEVIAMNSLTVNLHLMLTSFYRPTRERYQLLIEKRAFSSDRYAVASQIAQRGLDPATSLIEIAPRAGEATLHTTDICETIERHGATIATVMLPGVQYLTGQAFDLATITECAHRHGCAVGFDLAHAIGNVPLSLHDWNVDFAIWCGYKYLNGGPGAIGGCFVHERHAHSFSLPRCAGWWGHDKRTRFAMPESFVPVAGAEGWQVSNPSVLACAPLIASLDLFGRAGMQQLRLKSLALTGFLETLLTTRLRDAVTIISPSDPRARGCQLSLRLHRPPAAARAVHTLLTQAGCICDWREPDVIRVAPVPLYNTFAEVAGFADELDRALRAQHG